MPQASHSPSILLKVNQLHSSAEEKLILTGIDLEVERGTVHALMGPNGSGKSTLASCIAGHPAYTIKSGSITFANTPIIDLSPEERAHLGIFLVFQYPAAIPGVPIHQFLRLSLNSQMKRRGEQPIGIATFKRQLKQACSQLRIPWSFIDRPVNEGFSGGEKKRLEALQMLILRPKLIIMDEIDSGLDVDALKVIAQATNQLRHENPDTAVLLITHYQRILTLIHPDKVSVLIQGKVALTGDKTLAQHIDEKGYSL